MAKVEVRRRAIEGLPVHTPTRSVEEGESRSTPSFTLRVGVDLTTLAVRLKNPDDPLNSYRPELGATRTRQTI